MSGTGGPGRVAQTDASGHSKTAVIEGRLDIRDVANFARFLISNGEHIASRSDLLWRAMRSITETLKLSGIRCFETTEEAAIYMASLNIGSMNRIGRGGMPMNAFTLSRKIADEGFNYTAVADVPTDDLTVDDLVAIGRKVAPIIIRQKGPVADDTKEAALQRASDAAERDRLAREADEAFLKNITKSE